MTVQRHSFLGVTLDVAASLRDSAGALALACTPKAVAVTQDNADWAKEAMLRAWFEHANSGGSAARSRVKVGYSLLQLSS